MNNKQMSMSDICTELINLRSSLILSNTILDEMNFLNDETYNTMEIMEGIRVV